MLRSRFLVAVLLLAATAAAIWRVEWHMGLSGTIDHVLGALLVLSVGVFAAVVMMTVHEIIRKAPFPVAQGAASAVQHGWPPGQEAGR